MDRGKHRPSISLVLLAVAGTLTATLILSVGSASASDPPNSESGAGSVDSSSNTGNVDAQGLRERVPPSLFPAITETLQLDGAHEIYGAVQDVSGGTLYGFENPDHSLGAKLGPGGVSITSDEVGEWTWNLKFDEYGRGSSLDSVSEPSITAEGNRVEYQYADGVTEWYVNGPLGLQQGFTFESKPDSSNEGPLEVLMTISGGVTVEVDTYGTSAVISSQESFSSYTYGGLYAYDATGAELGARLESTSSGLSIKVDDVGAQYPINIDPFIEKGYLVGSADNPRTGLGMSVAVSGDTVVVGAPNSRWSDGRGVVYLFTAPDSGQTSIPDSIVLTSPSSLPGDSFGDSVSISGDTIVVGAPSERSESESTWPWSRAGAAYVFTKPAGGWASTSEASRLSAPEGQGEIYFGMSVVVSGDTVVAGTGSGAAYVFSKPGGGWADTSESARLTASDVSEDDRFGRSVTVSGDTVVVGAYLADLDDEEENYGAAYVYTKPSDGWEDTSDSVMLTAPDGAEGREFGRSLSMSSDTLVIGAPYTGRYTDYENYRRARDAEDKTPYLGAVYVYTKPATGWADAASPAKITNPDDEPWTEFGLSVSVNAETIAVGDPEARRATEDEEYAQRTGTAYVFGKPSEGWSSAAEHRELPMPERMGYDHYGSSISVSGDIAVVGAPLDDNENGSWAGSAHLFRKPTDGWISETPLPEPAVFKAFDGPAGDRFGHSVGVDGDLLVVGVPGDHERERGSAYGFVRQNTEWGSRRVRLVASDATPGGRFGTSVAVGKDTMAVGAPGREEGDDPGAVYVFTTPDGGWQRQYTLAHTAKLTIPDAPDDARFGYSVATDGDTIVVGAPGEGAVYVYSRPEAGWSQAAAPAKLTVSGGAASAKFGQAVAISGDSIVVGAPGAGAGAAYVFSRPSSGWANSSSAARLTASDGASGTCSVTPFRLVGARCWRAPPEMRTGKGPARHTCSLSRRQDGATPRHRQS